MTRYEWAADITLDEAADLLRIGAHWPPAKLILPVRLRDLWGRHSAIRSASWLIVSRETVDEFVEWMEEET